MSKEEKAKEYVSNIDFSNNTGIYIENEMKGTTYQGYIEGYTQAEQDLSSQLAAYKEALRETANELEKVFMDWFPYDDEEEIHRIGAIVDKAKTLIE